MGLRLGLRLRGMRRRDLDRGDLPAAGEIKPAVVAPHAFLDRRLPPERRAPPVFQRPGAKMGVVNLPVRRFDDLAVSGALQDGVGRVLRRQEMDVRMQFIRAVDGARPRYCHRVVVAGAALGGRQIVPAVALIEMRALDEAMRAAGKNRLCRADELPRSRVPLLQADAGEGRMLAPRSPPVAVVPDHVEEPFAAVVVVKERRIEAA